MDIPAWRDPFAGLDAPEPPGTNGFGPGKAMKRAPGMPAASWRPASIGTIWSSRTCMTSVGAFTLESRSVISKSPTTSKYRAAHSGEVVFRCSSLKIVRLLVRSPRDESPGEHLPKAWIVRAPSETHQSRHRLAHFFLSRSALLSAERERAIENKVRHAFRMPHRIGDGHGAALGYSEERETLDAGRIDDRLEVGHPGVERERVDVPVGHAVASRVVANQRMFARRARERHAAKSGFPNRIQDGSSSFPTSPATARCLKSRRRGALRQAPGNI